MIKSRQGFTLIEVMFVAVIITIIAAIAFPSYQAYVRKAAESGVTQEMLKISELLEKHKAKNFTYKCFDLQDYYGGSVNNLTTVNYPMNAVGSDIQYTLSLVDAGANNQVLADGTCEDPDADPDNMGAAQQWAIIATKNPLNLLVKDKASNFLITSQGIRCKNTAGNITRTGCGTGAEQW
ncbi:prepilin-type N-terminal cleavage/methylation domain-containing protein [Acinetobacter cumulans]|uniref:Prepilin-type N-terminal cleavage/methylation domain-containing protein n=1 Tax=Acinetobacter cumulans TaxID=2136182 RepID=A0ABX9U810_9GAMM|nr:prepilin-type N-terminal cleavage/methylation domain-containing protein [Acinetobacter cumulans]RLL48596.1 prepilin-type N-terminal cleavage/methylation domain-containing protein [Acinetobacter cumulans]